MRITKSSTSALLKELGHKACRIKLKRIDVAFWEEEKFLGAESRRKDHNAQDQVQKPSPECIGTTRTA